MRLDTLSERDLPVTIGRYTLTGILGEGGMARVFRAKMEGALGFRKPAAVKVVLPAMGSKSEGLRQQLIQEARLGGLLNHPNVVQTFDCGELEGFPYIAMELVEGCGLDDLVQEAGPLPPEAVLEVGLQVARGLHHAHTAKHEGRDLAIIHRDVKPSNVLLREDGVVKVMDFGIAKVQMEDALSTATGMTKGTPSYMSPEQLAADGLDGRTDLFALGAVLFYALTGKTLFTGSSLTEVMLRIIQVDETLKNLGILAQVDQLIPGFGAVLGRLLVKNRDDRYRSAAELEAELSVLRRRYPAGDKALAGLVKLHFGDQLAKARSAAASITGPSPFKGQGSDQIRAQAAAEEATPGPTRSFPSSTGGAVAGVAEVPRTVGMMKGTGPGGDWVRGTVDDGDPASDLPAGIQTRPQFPSSRQDPALRTTRPGRKRRRKKRNNRRQAFMMGAGIGLGLLLAVVVVLALDKRGAPEPPPAEDPTAAAEDPSTQDDAAALVGSVADNAAAAKAEAAKKEAERKEALKKEAARKEAARKDTAREEAARKEAARKEALARAAAEADNPKTESDAERRRREAAEAREARKEAEGAASKGSKGAKGEVDRRSDGRTGDGSDTPAAAARLSAEHVPVRRATMGTSKTVTVSVDGPPDTRVTMYWGPKGGPHKTTALTAQGSGVWKGTLTIDASVAAGLEYWIVVKHAATTPRVVALGRQSAPHSVAVY